jgi:H+/Cl- antiporter ClcA
VGKQFGKIWPVLEHRSWIMAGAAAGIAAAFNAPLAGVVFVLEELAQQHFHRFKTAVLTAAIIGGVVSQWLSDRYLFLGYPKLGVVPLSSIPWALGLGILAGLVSIPFFLMSSVKLRNWFALYFKTRIQIAAATGLLVAAIAVFLNSNSIGGGISVIQNLLFEPDYHADLTLVLARFLATTLSHLSGCAGGFLAPSLALGAAIGSWFADVTQYSNHNLLVLVGMSAFLSAVVRAPFTAWVIVMEMTDRRSAIFPLMVASLASYATSHFFQQKVVSKK